MRGDALNVRSDIYAVGVTLYYLLTGTTPFTGDTTMKLFANVLEQQPQSLASLRDDIPEPLAQAVMRCLEKTAGDRFESYAALRTALAPFSSASPKPAPLSLRTAAGVVDSILLSACNTLAGFYLLVVREGADADMWLKEGFGGQSGMDGGLFLLLGLAYYTVLEGRWGCSLGKRICGLRVIDHARAFPGYLHAFIRALTFTGVPMLPWLIAANMLMMDFERYSSGWFLIAMQFAGFAFWLLLFVTARKANGWRALQDLASGTHVIRRFSEVARPRDEQPEGPQPVGHTEEGRRVGPYHALEPLSQTEEEEWVLAYDTCLLRKVWIRIAGTGATEYPQDLRAVRRPGRVHWIGGKQDEDECWDVFEAPTGMPFLTRIEQPQSWAAVRFWLRDLAEELASSQEQGNPPAMLALDRLWIDAQGRAKILDFPAPGLRSSETASQPFPANEFFHTVARAALPASRVKSANDLDETLPVHARQFLENEARTTEFAHAHPSARRVVSETGTDQALASCPRAGSVPRSCRVFCPADAGSEIRCATDGIRYGGWF